MPILPAEPDFYPPELWDAEAVARHSSRSRLVVPAHQAAAREGHGA